MKTMLALLGGILALTAGTSSAQTDYDNLSASRSKRAPHVGMTMAETLARYGEPFNRVSRASGERWVYRLKFNEVYGRAWVPFFIDSDNVRLGTIDFGQDHRVRTFDWRSARSWIVD